MDAPLNKDIILNTLCELCVSVVKTHIGRFGLMEIQVRHAVD
jgi:hypothetical protein